METQRESYDTLAEAMDNVTANGAILCKGGRFYVGISLYDYRMGIETIETDEQQHEFETPTDAEFLIILEQALSEIDGLIDTMHHAPRDPFGDKEELKAYEMYCDISKRIYACQHNRYVEQNKPDDK